MGEWRDRFSNTREKIGKIFMIWMKVLKRQKRKF